MTDDIAVVRVAPGEGRLARRERALLFAPVASAAPFDAFAVAPQGRIASHVTAVTVDHPDVAFVLVEWDDDVRITVHGSAEIASDHPTLPRLTAAGVGTWVERTVDGPVVLRTPVEADPDTSLVLGVVAAGGFELLVAGPTSSDPATSDLRRASAPTSIDPTKAPDDTSAASSPVAPVADDRSSRPDEPSTPAPRPSSDAIVGSEGDVAGLDDAGATPASEASAPAASATGTGADPVGVSGDAPAPPVRPNLLAELDGRSSADDHPVPPDPPAAAPPASPTRTFAETDEHAPDHTTTPESDPPGPTGTNATSATTGTPTTSERGHDADDGAAVSPEAPPASSARARGGALRACASCLAPVPADAATCPTCGRPQHDGSDDDGAGVGGSWALEFEEGPVEAVDGPLLLGRSPSPDDGVRPVVVDCSLVSSDHLAVDVGPDGVTITDRHSRNRTFVLTTGDAQFVEIEPGRPHRVLDGTVVQIGRRRFTVRRRAG